MNANTETAAIAANTTPAPIDFGAIANAINDSGSRAGHARVIIRTIAANLKDSIGRDMRLLYVNGGVYTGKANERARVRVWLRQLPEMPASGAVWGMGGVLPWADDRVSDSLRAMIPDTERPTNGASAYFVTIVKGA